MGFVMGTQLALVVAGGSAEHEHDNTFGTNLHTQMAVKLVAAPRMQPHSIVTVDQIANSNRVLSITKCSLSELRAAGGRWSALKNN